MNRSGLKTLHLTLWQEFSKRSFIIQLIVVIFLVNYCRTLIFTRGLKFIFTLLAGAILLPLLIQRPLYLIFAIIILTASILRPETLPLIPFFGIGSLHITDLCLAVLLCYILGRKFYYKRFYQSDYPLIRTPMDIPLLLFFCSFVIALINGIVFQGGLFNDAFRTFREIMYYLLFFTITNLIKDKKDLSLFIRVIFIVAIGTALVSIAQQVLGTALPITLGRVELLRTTGFGTYADVIRAVPPGLLLMYICLITLVCITVSEGDKGNKLLRAAQIVTLSLGVIFAYYRSMWFTLLFAILLFFSFAPLKQKARIIAWGLLGIMGVILLFLYSMVIPESRVAKIVYASQERLISLFAVKAVKGRGSDTLRSRAKENADAVESILDSPILGIGLGTSYRPTKYFFSEYKVKVREKVERKKEKEGGEEEKKEEKFITKEKKLIMPLSFLGGMHIHNSFLNIPLRFGILGTISFVWLSITFLVRGLRNWRRIENPFFRAVCIGFTVSYVGTLLNSLIDPFLTGWRGVIGIAVMWGTNEVIYRIEGIEDKR